ncbi:MAG: hypothetical protein ACKO3W_09905 [bacterium]
MRCQFDPKTAARRADGAPAPRRGRLEGCARGVGAVLIVLAATGCGYTGDAEVESDTTQAPPAAATAGSAGDAAGDAAGASGRPPARSAYGKAMEAAHRLEDKVDAYNKKLEQAADDAFK